MTGQNRRAPFRGLRSSAGDELVLENNTFVELILPHSIQRATENEMAEYRRPFEEPGAKTVGQR